MHVPVAIDGEHAVAIPAITSAKFNTSATSSLLVAVDPIRADYVTRIGQARHSIRLWRAAFHTSVPIHRVERVRTSQLGPRHSQTTRVSKYVIVCWINLSLSQFSLLFFGINNRIMSVELIEKTGIEEWPTLASSPKEERKQPIFDDTGSGASSISDSSASDVSNGLSSVNSQDEKVKEAHTTYYPHPTSFKLGEHPIDDYRELKVRLA